MRGSSALVAIRRVAMSAAAISSVSMGVASSACAANKFVIATDGVASASSESSKDFLLSRPSGAYTTARTCSRGRRLFEWETHVGRTALSVAGMLTSEVEQGAAAAPLLETLTKPEVLRPRLDATVAAAVHEYMATHGEDGELKVTVLVTWDRTAVPTDGNGVVGSIACHIAPLPPLPSPPVRVEVRGAPRANAAAKDSSWVSERAPLEELMRGSAVGAVNELLLADDDGALLEGSQTNFFALVDGAVHTAGDGILAGTVRRLLLEVCEREGIPVKLTPPKLADAQKWEGALISSTSRLALPIDELYVPKEGKPSEAADCLIKFETGEGSLARRLQVMVTSEVESHSTEIPH